MARLLATTSLAFTVLLHGSLAAPAQFIQPFVSDLSFLPLKRAVSQDPSCPQGFLCEQVSCPSGIICPSGSKCLNFEGNLACGPTELSFCALNPSTLQAVGCDNGVCCHGNCYIGGSVCCENDSTQCSVGELCLACPSGQTCGSGGTCSSVTSTSSKSTSTSSIQTITLPSPVSSTIKQSTTLSQPTTASSSRSVTTTSSLSSTITSSQPITTTSTSTVTPSPTIVPSVGSFAQIGCYADSSDDRMLINGSRTDHGSNGMTVEKCADLAKGYQFAGVESAGDCFWGNIAMHNSSQIIRDCDLSCYGDPTEICGGGNRILVYQDAEWVLLTDLEIAQELRELQSLLQQLQALIAQWNEDLKDYNSALKSATGNKKRGDVLTLNQRGAQVNLDQKQILELLKPKTIQQKNLKLKFYLEIKVNQGQEKATQAIDEYISASDALQDAAEEIVSTDLAVPVIAEGAVPGAAEVAAVEQVVSAGAEIVSTIGTAEVIVEAVVVTVATGIFATLAELIKFFSGSSSTVPPPPPPTSKPPASTTRTTTTRSSTTSTTCTFTSTVTPIIIVINKQATSAQYDALVKSLPDNPKNKQFRSDDIGSWWYYAYLDQCTSEELWKNSIVDAMAIDNTVVLSDEDALITEKRSAPKPRRSPSDRNLRSGKVSDSKRKRELKKETPARRGKQLERNGKQVQRDSEHLNFTSGEFKIKGRDLTGESNVIQQINAPNHLDWLSAMSRQTARQGDYYAYPKYVYDDGGGQNLASQSWVYYIDGAGFRRTHQDFASRVGFYTNANLYGDLGLAPESPHGTNMASLAAGTWAGVAKDAYLGLVKLDVTQFNQAPVSSVMLAFDTIISHANKNKVGGRGVIGMSFYSTPFLLWWTYPQNEQPRGGNLTDLTDVFGFKLRDAFAAGLAAVASAGNFGTSATIAAQLYAHSPRRNGGTNAPLIVVGNCNYDNTRHPTSNFLDPQGRGILSIYAIGVGCVCATPAGDDVFGDPQLVGTSQATAITVGVIAQMLTNSTLRQDLVSDGLPRFGMRVKRQLLEMSIAQKGVFADGIPRLSNGISIDCPAANAIPGPAPVPALQAINPYPATTTGLTLATTVVASGLSVVGTPPPCYHI